MRLRTLHMINVEFTALVDGGYTLNGNRICDIVEFFGASEWTIDLTRSPDRFDANSYFTMTFTYDPKEFE